MSDEPRRFQQRRIAGLFMESGKATAVLLVLCFLAMVYVFVAFYATRGVDLYRILIVPLSSDDSPWPAVVRTFQEAAYYALFVDHKRSFIVGFIVVTVLVMGIRLFRLARTFYLKLRAK